MITMKTIKPLLAGSILALAAWGAVLPQAMAQDPSTPAQVVDVYLASLVNGDTQQLSALIAGRMQLKNRQLELNPDSYSQFLQDYYQGVQPTVEEIVPDGDKMKARVRFDRGTDQGSSIIEFILTQVDGQWKITDEVY